MNGHKGYNRNVPNHIDRNMYVTMGQTTENVGYTRNRNYNTAMRLKTIAYNIIVILNRGIKEKPKEIMKIAIFENIRHFIKHKLV